MEEKKKAGSVAVGMCVFIMIILVCAIIFVSYEYKTDINSKNVEVSNLNTSIQEKEEKINKLEEKIKGVSDILNENENIVEEDDFINNFSNSLSKQLGEGNEILINLTNYNGTNEYAYLSINKEHEAYIYLPSIKEFSSSSNLKKIADNVVNAWYCEQGQEYGNNYILFSKADGKVTYVRFRTDFSTGEKTIFESQEKELKGIKNIADVVTISGNGETGIGAIGVLLIKTDGTCLPFSWLDDLTE